MGICRNALTIFQAFKDREDQSSTGVGYGFAIPHARHQEIQQAGILFYRSSTPITNWESMDDQPITCAIALLIPEVSASEHLKVLAKIATKLLDEEFTAALKQETDVKNITKLLEDATKEPQ